MGTGVFNLENEQGRGMEVSGTLELATVGNAARYIGVGCTLYK